MTVRVAIRILRHVRYVAAGALCVALSGAAMAEDAPAFAALADFSLASDTDGFHATRSRIGALTSYANPWSYAGVVMQSTRYADNGFRKDGNAALGVYRDQRRDTLAGVDIEAGVVRVADRLRPIGELTLRMTTTLGTAIEINASADLVETRKALARAIGYTFTAVAADHQFGERFTLTALAGWQHFSDGNSRPHLRARLIWLALPDAGVTLQFRYRQYWSRQSDVDGAYFNPLDYRQLLAVVAIRRRYEGWIYSGAIGAGQEFSTGTGTRPSYLAEARGEGPIAGDARLTLRAGYYRSAGYADSPDYAYQQAGATLVLPFR